MHEMHRQFPQQKERQRSAHEGMVGGAILIALGVVILSQRFFDFAGFGFPWQLFIIGPGIMLFGLMILGGRKANGLAIPASVITTIGMILLVQSVFDYFESWAYVWALIPTAVGVGTMIAGLWGGNQKMIASGKQGAKGGLGMFLAFAAFFELLIFQHGRLTSSVLILALIVGGGFLVVRGLLRQRARDRWEDDALPPPASTTGEGEVFPY